MVVCNNHDVLLLGRAEDEDDEEEEKEIKETFDSSRFSLMENNWKWFFKLN